MTDSDEAQAGIAERETRDDAAREEIGFWQVIRNGRHYLLTASGFFLFLAVLLWFYDCFQPDSFACVPFNTTHASLSLGVTAILAALWIAVRQEEHLSSIRRVGEDTRGVGEKTQVIIRKLDSQSLNERLVDELFGTEKYTIALPAQYKSKPLPFVEAGDYHTFHLLAHHLLLRYSPEQRLALKYVNRFADELPPVPDGNLILVCTPYANKLLAALLPPFCKGADSPADFKRKHQVPAWFATTGREEDEPWIQNFAGRGALHELRSPCEAAYQEASELGDGEPYDLEGEKVSDLAVFARMTRNDRTIFVMAGVHQFGTYIVGDFVDKIVRGHRTGFEKYFFGKDDFFSIIWGSFDSDTLRVNRVGINQEMLWTRKTGQNWVKMEPTGMPVTRATDVQSI